MISGAASKQSAHLPHGGTQATERGACGSHFSVGESVCSLTRIRNEGTYPHRDIGEILVREGDLGYVHESWSLLNEVYYTVEFVRHAVVVIMRGREMTSIGVGPDAAQ